MAVDLSFGSTAFPRSVEVRQRLYDSGAQGIPIRFRRLDRLHAFYCGLEYAHQETSWDGQSADMVETISHLAPQPFGFTQPAAEKRAVEKRPTAPLRLCPMVVDRFTGLLFSKKRSPKVAVEGDPDANDFWTAVAKKTLFWRTMYQARTFGGAMGSSLITVQLRDGRFSYRAHNPKHVCDVVWEDPDLKIPAGVLIQYTFPKETEVLDEKTGRPTGRVEMIEYLYRRIIDQHMDVCFVPAKITSNVMPELQVDEHATYEHGLGRFPGVWIQNLPCDDEIDGVSDCDGAYQMFDTIDRQIAQSNKGLLANQDPTLVISRDRKEELSGIPLKKGSENALNVGIGGSAQYLEIGGTGISAAQEFVKMIRQAAMDKTQVILSDPERMAGAAQSALAIELLYQPMLEKADRLREQYGQAIEQIVDITLELARLWSDPLKYEGVAVPSFDLPPRVEEVDMDPDNPDSEQGVMRKMMPRHPGSGGSPVLSWGPYFAPTPQDVQAEVGIIATAYGGGLLDLETAVKKIGPLLDVEDVEGLLRRVREESVTKSEIEYGESPTFMSSDVQERLDRNKARFSELDAMEDQEPDQNDEQGMEIANASDMALNGAQVSSAKEIILEVAAGKLPRDTGIEMLINFFNINSVSAEKIMGPVGKTFLLRPDEIEMKVT